MSLLLSLYELDVTMQTWSEGSVSGRPVSFISMSTDNSRSSSSTESSGSSSSSSQTTSLAASSTGADDADFSSRHARLHAEAKLALAQVLSHRLHILAHIDYIRRGLLRLMSP